MILTIWHLFCVMYIFGHYHRIHSSQLNLCPNLSYYNLVIYVFSLVKKLQILQYKHFKFDLKKKHSGHGITTKYT